MQNYFQQGAITAPPTGEMLRFMQHRDTKKAKRTITCAIIWVVWCSLTIIPLAAAIMYVNGSEFTGSEATSYCDKYPFYYRWLYSLASLGIVIQIVVQSFVCCFEPVRRMLVLVISSAAGAGCWLVGAASMTAIIGSLPSGMPAASQQDSLTRLLWSTFAWACIQCICLGGLLVRVRNLMQEVQKEREIEASMPVATPVYQNNGQPMMYVGPQPTGMMCNPAMQFQPQGGFVNPQGGYMNPQGGFPNQQGSFRTTSQPNSPMAASVGYFGPSPGCNQPGMQYQQMYNGQPQPQQSFGQPQQFYNQPQQQQQFVGQPQQQFVGQPQQFYGQPQPQAQKSFAQAKQQQAFAVEQSDNTPMKDNTPPQQLQPQPQPQQPVTPPQQQASPTHPLCQRAPAPQNQPPAPQGQNEPTE